MPEKPDNHSLDEQLADYTDAILSRQESALDRDSEAGPEIAGLQKTVRLLRHAVTDTQPGRAVAARIWPRLASEWRQVNRSRRASASQQEPVSILQSLWQFLFGRPRNAALSFAVALVVLAMVALVAVPGFGKSLAAAAGNPNNVILAMLLIGCLVFIGLLLWTRRKP